MNRLRCILPFIAAILLFLGAGCLQEREAPAVTETTPATGHEAMVLLLDTMTESTQDTLSGLDAATSEAAFTSGTSGLSGPDVDAVLGRVAAAHPAITSVITFDLNGTVISAEPDGAKVLVGMDLDDQEAVRRVIRTQQPLMSDLFAMAQGIDGAVIEYPVFSADGNFTGVVSTAFRPYGVVSPAAEDAAKGTPYTFMVAQTDGRILYDPDPEEVGKETFNETLYAEFPEIIEFARQYSGNRTGYGTYSFYSTGFGKVVRKEAFWSTVELHGTEWRVMVIGEL